MIAEATPGPFLGVTWQTVLQRRESWAKYASLSGLVTGSQSCPTAAKAVSCIAALRTSRVKANATPVDAPLLHREQVHVHGPHAAGNSHVTG